MNYTSASYWVRFSPVLLWLFCLTQTICAQVDSSDYLRISLLTCAPGEDIYSIFGHSAIRVQDLRHGEDLVYNYGTFDFNEPGFEQKFLNGKLNYSLATQKYDRFIDVYDFLKRSVVEQEVRLDKGQKIKVNAFLRKNYRPENRHYLYDFFYDNCATRIRDVFENESGASFLVPNGLVRGLSFRDGLDQYNHITPWIDFGMDLILGLPADRQMDFQQEMYLPDYLQDNLSRYIINQDGVAQSFLGPKKNILLFERGGSRVMPWPLILFSVLFILILLSQLFIKSISFHRTLDIILFSVLGVVGCIIAYMWFGTDHVPTKNNLNILWAHPFYFMLVYLLIKKKSAFWPILIFLIVAALLLAGWRFSPQSFHMAVMPILGIIVLRCINRLRHGGRIKWVV